VFGAALTRPADVVTVEKAAETTIEVTGVGAQYIPEDPKKHGRRRRGGARRARADPHRQGVRPASGLGSSAASAAGAAVALNRLYDRGLSRSELVPIAAEGEAVVSGVAHSDNVAPSILGGFTVTTSEGTHAVDASIPLVVCLPDVAVSTRDARRVVPETASMDDLVETVGNAATLAIGMCRSDPDLVGAGMSDPVVTTPSAPA